MSKSLRLKLLYYSNQAIATLLLTYGLFTPLSAASFSKLLSPLPAISANELAVIVNDSDPLSIKIANYYQQQRKIPEQNIIHISFNPGQQSLAVKQFKQIKLSVDQLSAKHIQAYALTWMQPYRVGCMSITTAFAAGYNHSFCAKGCKQTLESPYFNSEHVLPYTEFKWRPTMALAGKSFSDVKALIDRGVASDFNQPKGSAYLLTTSDKQRSTRSVFFPSIVSALNGLWQLQTLEQDYIENKQDVMFYFTGKTHIKKIQSNHFLPGAVADHLTSTGGILSGSKQMSIIKWLEAGATGSYGTVVEPCNFVQKFPHPGIMMHYYIRGNSLIEAYWKSVAWPGQGIFIGEPLAKPFAYQ
ncbi:MAG: TIGR03790 family protein [Methylococcaceae bacterium]